MTAKIEVLDASFAALDALEIETLALFFLSDRRPLRGAAGIVDWRLCGALSAALKEGKLNGALGERLLMSTQGRLSAKRLLVFGAGASAKPLEAAELGHALTVARNAGARELAVELPANVDPAAAVTALRTFEGTRLVVVGPAPALRKAIAERGG